MRYSLLLILFVGCNSKLAATPTPKTSVQQELLTSGIAHADRGEYDAAVIDFTQLLSLQSNNIEALYQRGVVLSRLGRDYDARQDFKRCLAMNETHVGARVALGTLYQQIGRYAEALANFEQAVKLEPNRPECAFKLAWLLATCPADSVRDGTRALKYSRLAMQMGGQKWKYLDAHAAALAETGNFHDAMVVLSGCNGLVPQDQRVAYKQHLECYEAHKAWREGPAEVELPDIFNTR